MWFDLTCNWITTLHDRRCFKRGPLVLRVWRENVFGRKGQMFMLKVNFEKQIEVKCWRMKLQYEQRNGGKRLRERCSNWKSILVYMNWMGCKLNRGGWRGKVKILEYFESTWRNNDQNVQIWWNTSNLHIQKKLK